MFMNKKQTRSKNFARELENYKIDVSKLDEKMLKKMLESVNSERKFVVPLADVGSGQALEKGKIEPLTPYQAKKKKKKDA